MIKGNEISKNVKREIANRIFNASKIIPMFVDIESVANSRIPARGSICVVSWYSVSNECQVHSNQIREAVYLRSRVRLPGERRNAGSHHVVNVIHCRQERRKRVLHTSVTGP